MLLPIAGEKAFFSKNYPASDILNSIYVRKRGGIHAISDVMQLENDLVASVFLAHI